MSGGEELEEELPYSPGQLDRDVVAKDQIRTVIQTFRDKITTEIFPGREYLPKTIVFAKDDSHADDIVEIVREEFAKGNDFCQKITYRTTGAKPEDLITQFRNSFNPRIVVTVDMIATGTDIKPVEVVFFMRNVRNRNFFEQMKGRGVRTISTTDFNAVTPDAKDKERFVIVDAVGVTESELSESFSLDRHPSVPFDKLLDMVAMGDREPDTLSSLASRLARLDRRLSPQDRKAVEDVAGGATLKTLVSELLNATDPDVALKEAQQATGQDDPPEEAIAEAEKELLDAAAKPFAANPELRQRLIEIHRAYEQTIDTVSQDTVIRAEFSGAEADALTRSFREYIEENRDEITALQVLYQRPYRQRLSYTEIRALADALQTRPVPGPRPGCGTPTGSLTSPGCAAPASGCWPTLCRWCAMPSETRRNWHPSPSVWRSGSAVGWRCRRPPGGNSPPSSASGWRPSRTTSPAASASIPATSSTPLSPSGAASFAPTPSSVTN